MGWLWPFRRLPVWDERTGMWMSPHMYSRALQERADAVRRKIWNAASLAGKTTRMREEEARLYGKFIHEQAVKRTPVDTGELRKRQQSAVQSIKEGWDKPVVFNLHPDEKAVRNRACDDKLKAYSESRKHTLYVERKMRKYL